MLKRGRKTKQPVNLKSQKHDYRLQGIILTTHNVSAHGKLLGKPNISQNLGGAEIQGIEKAITRLRQKGVLAPELLAYDLKGRIFLTRIGSKRRALKANSLQAYLERINSFKGKIPGSYMRQLSSLLSSAARTIAVLHTNGIAHGHPHFRNFVVSKSKVGIHDFRLVETTRINWKSAEEAWSRYLADDFNSIEDFGSWRIIERSSGEKRQLLEKLRRKFYEKIVQYYPFPPEEKRKFMRILQRNLFL
ncbi:MAG TPA: hypothetical protein HA227_01825 [Candidatus Diapherotrites archaeon]|uniref:Protein kinase domain-containing protein n=1 Tax=Candidatus Iainarchaeum sp. TaxID=3101447 RepID=A0A7J4KV23_9ARCH|nr:hypothetical protein [Candidatus Diapherotrites archaeon]